MLKMRAEESVDPEGRLTKQTVFSCGPFRSCTKCPCLVIDAAREGATCGFYGEGLTETGDYPRKCKVTGVTVTEKF